MNLSLDNFCVLVTSLNRPNAEKALSILWYHDCQQAGVYMTSGGLTRIMEDHHVATPNSTQLADAIRKSKFTNESKSGFCLKPGSRRLIREWFTDSLDGVQPAMDHSTGFLPEALWIGTRGYIEAVCKQLNGCFHSAYYDASLVMLRRFFETLIIEAYDQQGRSSEIKDNGGAGNYYMLSDLVERASGKNKHIGLNLGRNTKNALESVKALGDRSAHDRRFNAHVSDLMKIQIDVRSGAQDLIAIAFPSRK